MKKLILNLGLILAVAGSMGIAGEVALKECKNEQDKMSGCVVKKYWKYVDKNGTHESENLFSETPYKNRKLERYYVAIVPKIPIKSPIHSNLRHLKSV